MSSLAHSFVTDDGAERRSARRVRVTCPAVLETITGDCAGSLWDMSEGGARLQMAVPPNPGSAARLRWAGRMAVCTVVWSEGDMCGVVFEQAIAPEIVSETVNLNRVVELPIAQVRNIVQGQKRSAFRASLGLAASD